MPHTPEQRKARREAKRASAREVREAFKRMYSDAEPDGTDLAGSMLVDSPLSQGQHDVLSGGSLSAIANLLNELLNPSNPGSPAAARRAVTAFHSALTKRKPSSQGDIRVDASSLAYAATSLALGDSERAMLVDIMRVVDAEVSAAILTDLLQSATKGSPIQTKAALALARLGSRESVSGLMTTVDRLSLPQRQACIRVLRSARTHWANEAIFRIGAFEPEVTEPWSSGHLDWTVLPSGWWRHQRFQSLVTAINSRPGQQSIILERLQYVDSLLPKQAYLGRDRLGSDAYWVFVFDQVVVAECPLWGNAIYVIRGTNDWKELLSKSKRDLLSSASGRVRRILHTGDWKQRLKIALNGE
jgi:hypothetical protein